MAVMQRLITMWWCGEGDGGGGLTVVLKREDREGYADLVSSQGKHGAPKTVRKGMDAQWRKAGERGAPCLYLSERMVHTDSIRRMSFLTMVRMTAR
jgi:hypothetical protein